MNENSGLRLPKSRTSVVRTGYVAVFCIATLLLICSFGLAIYAWINTPDPADFWHFAQPSSSKHASKVEYLFDPPLLGLLGWLAVLIRLLLQKVQDKFGDGLESWGGCVFIMLWLVGILGGTAVQASNALDAALRTRNPPAVEVPGHPD